LEDERKAREAANREALLKLKEEKNTAFAVHVKEAETVTLSKLKIILISENQKFVYGIILVKPQEATMWYH
jgi:hypothetical protein